MPWMTDSNQSQIVFVSDGGQEFKSLLVELQVESEATQLIEVTGSSAGQVIDPNLIGELLTAGIDAILFMTAVGVRSFVERSAATTDRKRLLHAVQDCKLISGSLTTTAALNEYGLQPALSADSLPDWRTSLQWLQTNAGLSHSQIAIESTLQDSGLVAGLESRGVCVDFMFGDFGNVQSGPDEIEQTLNRQSVLVVASPTAAKAVCRSRIHSRLTNRSSKGHIVVAFGSEVADFLSQNGCDVAWVADSNRPAEALSQFSECYDSIVGRKQKLLSLIHI